MTIKNLLSNKPPMPPQRGVLGSFHRSLTPLWGVTGGFLQGVTGGFLRGVTGGFLLFIGSISLLAQGGGDPFGKVNYRKYANNMSLTAFVRMVTMVDGKWVPAADEVLGKGTVVAAYCGEELRGKDSPMDDAGYTDILYLDIYGDNKGDKLHFKVFVPEVPGDLQSPGRVIEVDQGLTYASDDIIGSPESPYYIDLPVPVVTTPSTEGWGTTCLPFNAVVPEGVTVWNVTGIENNALVMTKVEGSILPKDTPVLLQSESKANYEWLSRVADGNVSPPTGGGTGGFTGSILRGTTEATDIAANSVLTLGHATTGSHPIGFWLYNGTTIPANRAYIADFPSGSRGFALFADDVTTSIGATSPPSGGLQGASSGGLRGALGVDLLGRPVNERMQGKNGAWKKGENGQIIHIGW